MAALHLLSAAATAAGLLAFARMLTTVFGARAGVAAGIAAAVPEIALIAACAVTSALASSGAQAAQARLSPGVRRIAEDDLVQAACRVESSLPLSR